MYTDSYCNSAFLFIKTVYLSNRFNASDLGQWKYSYNPCRSFSQGPPQQSDCFGDVAVSCYDCFLKLRGIERDLTQVI